MDADAATASAGGSAVVVGASSVRNHAASWTRSAAGMPSTSPITRNGSGAAKPATRSTTASSRRAQVVQQMLDELLDPRREGVHPAPAECGRDERPQPGVVRRVDAEHVPGERRTGQPLGEDRSVERQRGMHVLGQVGWLSAVRAAS